MSRKPVTMALDLTHPKSRRPSAGTRTQDNTENKLVKTAHFLQAKLLKPTETNLNVPIVRDSSMHPFQRITLARRACRLIISQPQSGEKITIKLMMEILLQRRNLQTKMMFFFFRRSY
jgi:hypothetical protein